MHWRTNSHQQKIKEFLRDFLRDGKVQSSAL